MNRIILTAILLVFYCSIVGAIDYLDKKQFTEEYLLVVNKLYPSAKTEISDEMEVRILLPDDEELTSFLNNAYAEYRSSPEDLESILKNYAESIAFSKELGERKFHRTDIFPVIKDKLYVQQVEEMFKKANKKGLIYEKLNDTLYVLYAFDTPKAIQFMTEADLDDIDVMKSELRELSKSNLKKSIPELKLEGDPASLAMLVADGTYEASFILFEKIWTKEKFPVKGDIVIYIPTRDVVLITGSEDEINLAKVHDIVYNNENEWPHVVAEIGFVRVENSWKEFRPK